MTAGLRAAVGFLTVVGGAAPTDRRAAGWFPAVGAGVGVAVGLTWWVGTTVWNPLVGAVLAVAVDLVLTGLLHLDGLADSADGLLPPLARDRRLAVMHDPAVGAFGVAVVVLTLALRVAALTALAPSLAPAIALCAALWGASRAVAALVLARGRGAPGSGGLAARFQGGATAAPAAALGVAAVVAALAAPAALAGVAGVVACVVASAAVVALAGARIGGHTGDVLGAAIVVSETVGLLVAGAGA